LDLSGTERGAGGVGGLIALTVKGGVVQFVGYDGNGNVAGLTQGDSGTLSARYQWGPFGEPVKVTGATPTSNPFRFSTKYQDDETRFFYYGYRFYNARTGTWLSRDPKEEKGGLNLYGFVRNNPVASVDPHGESCLNPCGFWKDSGLVPTGVRGGVLCCLGQKYACSWDTSGFSGLAAELFATCIVQHELAHFDDVQDCPLCGDWPVTAPWKIPVDIDLAECNSYIVSLDCLTAAKASAACQAEPLCPGQVQIAIEETWDKLADHNCY
jgi:RHS repeat-associated protein